MRLLLILLLSATALTACRKKVAVCKGHCAPITLSGRIYDAASNTGFANVPLETFWANNSTCLFCSSPQVGSIHTDGNGFFSYSLTVDTSNFTSKHLITKVQIPAGYITHATPYAYSQLFDYSQLWNIQFGFYPETALTIKLHRVIADNFTHFSLNHSYVNNSTIGTLNFSSPSQAKDTIVNTYTAVGIKTIIRWKKVTAPGVYTEQKDSIVASKTGPNVIDIYY
jgi:hypothetical protein